jgi:hypothetical protein
VTARLAIVIALVLVWAGAVGEALHAAPSGAEWPTLDSVPPDLRVPPMTDAPPGPGRRVRQTAPGFEGSAAHHALYLPVNWQPGRRYPVLVEYAGNGGYTNNLGDFCAGTVEGCNLGYGLSGGSNFIWVCLPFVEVTNGRAQNALRWWGEVEQTIRYAESAVEQVCRDLGGDTNALILCGFSRGAIAANFIGLHSDAIASRWRAFFTFSHYDGVRTGWPYAGADRASALARLRRLNGRPQFISAEGTTKDIQDYLTGTGVKGDFTFVPVSFANHSDRWVLRDLPERRLAREWLARVLDKTGPAR